jgi:hypothetical protein
MIAGLRAELRELGALARQASCIDCNWRTAPANPF